MSSRVVSALAEAAIKIVAEIRDTYSSLLGWFSLLRS